MKDLKNLMLYGGLSSVAILMLIVAYNSDAVPKAAVGFVAIFLVVVLPVIVAVKIADKERQAKLNK